MATDRAPDALQPERTGLAWVRTLIVIAGTWGLVAFHAYRDHGWTLVALACAVIALTTLVTCGWIGTARGRRARQAMAAHRPVAVPLSLMWITVISTAVAVAALASSLASLNQT